MMDERTECGAALDLLLAGRPPKEPPSDEAVAAMTRIFDEHGVMHVFCIVGGVVEKLLKMAAQMPTSQGPCPDLTPKWNAVGSEVIQVIGGMAIACRNFEPLIRAMRGRMRGRDALDISGLDKASVLQALYNASKPVGLGNLHYDPEPMTRARAEELLSVGHDFDYLQGRVLKIDLGGDTLRTDLYDRDNGPGAAANALSALIEQAAKGT